MTIKKYGYRNWAVYDDSGYLICVTVYKKGAKEVLIRLTGAKTEDTTNTNNSYIDLQELIRLQKELRQLSKKLNDISKKIKSGNMPTRLFYNQNNNEKDVDMYASKC
jgi:hypothetical protein